MTHYGGSTAGVHQRRYRASMDNAGQRITYQFGVVGHRDDRFARSDIRQFHSERPRMWNSLDELTCQSFLLIFGHGHTFLKAQVLWFTHDTVASRLILTLRHTTLNSREADMTVERLSFKEMCARFEVTPRTLRYYEYIELLAPEKEGRSRFYGPREVARMTLILRGRRWGFSLEEIRQWLLIYESEGTQQQYRTFVEYADRQLEALKAERTQLDETIADLEAFRAETAKSLG